MNLVIAFILSSMAFGNVFELTDSSSRFVLKITPHEFVFESEDLEKTFPIKPCNLALARNLNAELLSLIPQTKVESGLSFKIDHHLFKVSPHTDLGKQILAMEPRILRFSLQVEKACK